MSIIRKVVNRLQPVLQDVHLKKGSGKQAIAQYLERSLRILRTPPLLSPRRTWDYIIFPKRPYLGPPRLEAQSAYTASSRHMFSYVQFLTTPTADTPGTTLVVHFDSRRYLIGNISEGTQRACIQRKVALAKVEDLFLTGKVDWASTGGILGMTLTLADILATREEDRKQRLAIRQAKKLEQGLEEIIEDVPKQQLRLHGGRNLTHLLATARRFIFRKGMPLFTNEIREEEKKDWSPTWTDSNINVWALPISPAGSSITPQNSRRKRSSDEISGDVERPLDLDGVPVNETKEEQENRYDQMRNAVVRNMFSSAWTLDSLTKMPLKEVMMPASIFVRDVTGKVMKYDGPMPGKTESLPDIEVLVRKPWPAASIRSLPPTTPSKTALSYVVRGHDQRGKFDVKKALSLMVKPGGDFGALTKGKSVKSLNGETVTPDMVLGPSRIGGGFAVMEIPSEDYIEPLLNREEWTVKDIMEGVGSITWILGAGVKVEGRLEKFMVDHPEWEHIVSSPDYCSNYLALGSSAAAAIRLHQIDSEHFPIPSHSNSSTVKWSAKEDSNSKRPFHIARAGHRFKLYPNMLLTDEHTIQYLDTAAVINEASPELLELAESSRKEVSDPAYLAKLEEQQKDIPSKDAEVISLGTGSSLPSKYRNVSATLVCVPGYGNYLLDCGENTLGQLKRVFGPELPSILQNLKMIWISHLHADHHLGTATIIKEWHQATEHSPEFRDNKLVVASDEAMLDWLREYSSMEDFGYNRIEPISLSKNTSLSKAFSPSEVKSYGLTSIEACPVSHCHGALAVVLNFPNTLKIAYSGDCRPSNEFARIGKGATLLIHEATFDDELRNDAQAKKHSTTGEALDVGRRMGARRILLTHFSQRYQKIPVMSGNGKEGVDVRAGVCFDYMRIKIGDIAKLEAFRPTLLKLYEEKEWPEEDGEEEEEVVEEAPVVESNTARKKREKMEKNKMVWEAGKEMKKNKKVGKAGEDTHMG